MYLNHAREHAQLSHQVAFFIYDLIVLKSATESDITDYLNYEANEDNQRKELIMSVINACKTYQMQCMLASKEPHPSTHIHINESFHPLKMKYKYEIRELD